MTSINTGVSLCINPDATPCKIQIHLDVHKIAYRLQVRHAKKVPKHSKSQDIQRA